MAFGKLGARGGFGSLGGLGGAPQTVFNMPVWTAAKARVAAGTGNAKLLFMGTSTTVGAFSQPATTFANCRVLSYPMQLIPSLANTWDQSWAGTCGIYPTDTFPSYDPRFVANNWTLLSGSTTMGGRLWANQTTTDPIAFTPPLAFDTIEIWSPQAAGLGTFTVNVDGGATLATIVQAGSSLYKKNTISCALGTHTLNLTRSSGNVYIAAINCFDSTQKKIHVFNAGWSGSKATDWNDSTFVYSSPLPALTAHAADLTVCVIGENDWGKAPITTLANFAPAIQAIITAVKAGGGDMILGSGIPSDASVATVAAQQDYINIMASAARSNGINFINFTQLWGSYVQANANGWMANTIHPNGAGYSHMATSVLARL